MVPTKSTDVARPAFNFLLLLWLLVPTLVLSAAFNKLLFCVDILLLPLIESKLPRKWILALRCLWVLLLGLVLLGWWNILPKSYMFYLHSIGYVPAAVKVLGLGTMLVLAWFVGTRFGSPVNERTARILFAAGLILVSGKIGYLVQADTTTPRMRPLVTVVPSGLKVLVVNNRAAVKGKSGTLDTPTFLRYIENNPALPNKVVLLLVESWGESPGALRQITDQVAGHGVEVVESGYTSYSGATLQGEFREICSEQVELTVPLLSEKLKRQCAPQVFARASYDVIALHGFQMGFYARALIWKNLGFTETYFDEDLGTLAHCGGGFPGVCDAALIDHGIGMLTAREKAFLYIVTLSSHEPVTATLAVPDQRLLTGISAAGLTQIVARNAVTAAITRLQSMANKECVLAYVVGDHQPPSLAGTGSAGIAGKVPYMVLKFHC